MKFREYQEKAIKTAIYPRNTWKGVYYATMGLAGEAGEIANKIKKHIRDGALNFEDIANELGDVLWYCAALATELGLDLGHVAEGNLIKLEDRADRDTISGEGDTR